ncbi:MAG: hypothetical protein JWM25_1862 [Thermoleophilia bacterium]|nr:hypothetical protein [Thermoleophilia bacterium]MCZ4497277.1 hypothetical protein [Thermoleophilia bacterium]
MLIARSTPNVASDRERGGALVAAIVLMLLASFIIVAIMVSSFSSRDGTRSKQEDATGQEVARTAGTVLSSIYSSLSAGEHDGFVPNAATLTRYVDVAGGAVVANSSLRADLGTVDTARVPAYGRFTVQQPLSGGRMGNWQVYSVKLPTWGTTKAGKVVVFVRIWTAAGGTTTKPIVYRMEFRPSWFADYQMLIDGPIRFGIGATLEGRVHSNGYQTSFFNSYASWAPTGDKIRIDPGVTCTASARVSTSVGNIVGCGSVARPNTGARINLLRARDTAAEVRRICQGPAAERPGISMACPAATSEVTVSMSPADNMVRLSTGEVLNANVTNPAAGIPGTNQGAVVVLAGDANLVGSLGANARAMVVSASVTGATNYGTGSAPTINVRGGGNVGSANGQASSSFGALAEGDLIFHEQTACGVTMRGAIVTMSGLTSIAPTWRTPIPTAGGYLCPGTAEIAGSISGHYSPLMNQPGSGAGYQFRRYKYLPALYDNPPPMFPTASDWEVSSFAPANLDCFARSGATYTLVTTREGCA